uniref:Iron-containing nitrile hydratase subunit beta n=1 Tax=Rhodococcus sp. TaxID=1831 RepID=NHAB_RHOSO|nr:RecName: Full=Nitrile hydratase subunit beta; Short=NHase; Short=Nitrilase [Rhodococcus sp. (in: high G+C Gram-positive bacteria)]AAA26184.1 nitrile hydratase beta subunit [Rhodococcus sp. (in: high G+C Gram-positive bacteria)]
MNGVFDLGGTDGIGPVDPPAEEPVFRADWEKAAFTMFSALFRAGWFGIDEFRHGVEKMDPALYLKSPYYKHWIASFEYHGKRTGKLDLAELDRRTQYYLANPDAPLPEHGPNQELIDFANAVVPSGAPAIRPTDKEPRFKIGDVVRMSSDVPFGHTRIAGYVRGKVGRVISHHGSFVYPDSAGNGRGDDPQHLYTLQFDATELWGEQYAEPNVTTTFDAWDPYLTLVTAPEGAAA